MNENGFKIGDKLGRRFIMISLVYFIIGTLWMGPIGLLVPSLPGLAGTIYDTAKMHLVFIGFVAFSIIGMIYYIAPRLGGKPLYSGRLGNIHFWISNIFLPIVVITYATVIPIYQNIINSPGLSPSNFPSGLMATYLFILMDLFIGIAVQAIFAYNIYRTIR